MSILRVRRAVRLLVQKGNISVLRVRKEDMFLRENRGHVYIDGS